jgi:putative flippase GtrA
LGKLKSSKTKLTEVLWFVLVGALTAILYLGLFTFLYQVVSLPAPIAAPSAYFVAVILHFYLNNRFTFSSSDNSNRYTIVRYVMFAVAAFFAQFTLVYFLIWQLGFGVTHAVGVAAIAVPIVSFFTMKIWVFRKGST